jgi:hypothetical protein
MLNSNALLVFPAAITIAVGCGSSNAISGNQQPAEQPNVSQEMPTNSITGRLSRKAVTDLSRLYEISNPDRVFWFLNEHIANLLVNAASVISEYFERPRISLELRSDPESGSDVLLAFIHTNLGWEESEAALETFDRNWWLSQTWIPSTKRISIDVRSA